MNRDDIGPYLGLVCPICGRRYIRTVYAAPSLSHIDGKTEVCASCYRWEVAPNAPTYFLRLAKRQMNPIAFAHYVMTGEPEGRS